MANDKVRITTEIPYKALPDIAPYEKNSSYGPAQYNRLRSPASPKPEMTDWGHGSFEKNGRARSSLERTSAGYDKVCDYKVEHTTDRIK